MGTSRLKLTFYCTDDCRQEGCPKHEMEFINYHTSCTCEIKIDGVRMFLTDWARMKAITELWSKDMGDSWT
jgi:hypothetical protein